MSGCFRFVTQSPCRPSRLWGEFFFLFSDSTLPAYFRCVFPSYFQKNGCLRKLSLLRRGAFLLCLYISIGIPGLQDGILYKMANFSLCKEKILVIYTIPVLTCSRPCARISLLGGSLGAALRLSKNRVIASQCSHWRGNPPDFQTFSSLNHRFLRSTGGFPHQSADWFGMTTYLSDFFGAQWAAHWEPPFFCSR